MRAGRICGDKPQRIRARNADRTQAISRTQSLDFETLRASVGDRLVLIGMNEMISNPNDLRTSGTHVHCLAN